MHLISIKNNKLIKRVAVASLAALLTIPSLTMNSYADALSMAEKRLKNYEQQLKNYEAYGNTEMVEKTKERIAQTKNDIEKAKQNNEVKAQKAAQEQALQAEKDRIANTVYPLTARYVKDFVPAVDDYQPHFYERPELPGVIFTLQQDSFGKLVDIKPNIKITEMPDYYRETDCNGNKELLYTDTCQVIKVSYISPFNFAGKVSLGDFGLHSDLNNAALMAGWCHWIGENMEVQYDKTVNMHYKSGWPESYIGKQVNEITEANAIQPYGWYPTVTFRRKSIEEIKASARVYFSADEKVDSKGTAYKHMNEDLGSSWVDTQDIYSVARERGTDYTDEERQTLVIKPTPVNTYTNAGSEPIVDEQEWIDANINYDRNPQSLSDEEWWK